MLGTPVLDAGLKVGAHRHGVEGKNHLSPAAHAALDATNDWGKI